MLDGILYDSLLRNIGRTVTIFTTSGGLSGSGFTGVLAAVTPTCVKLITDIGAPPACPVGSACDGEVEKPGYLGFGPGLGYGYGAYGYGAPFGYGAFGYGAPYGVAFGAAAYGAAGYGVGCGCVGGGNNFLGAITEIPLESIASFTHNAI